MSDYKYALILINSIENMSLRLVFRQVMRKFNEEEYNLSPGSLNYHHPYIGGLHKHNLEVYENTVVFSRLYNLTWREKDILKGCSIIHDLFKIQSYNTVKRVDHIVEMVNLLEGLREADNDEDISTIIGIMETHHSTIEFGSIREPETDLEKVFAISDYTSAHVNNKYTNKN